MAFEPMQGIWRSHGARGRKNQISSLAKEKEIR
jgi:hypothetical protein